MVKYSQLLVSVNTYYNKIVLFKTFIKEQGITEANFVGALRWVVIAYHTEKKAERWWEEIIFQNKKELGENGHTVQLIF